MTNFENQKPGSRPMEKISAMSNSPKVGLLVHLLDIILKVGSSI